MSKSVSLVLGSGGARGLAHIGVIRCLEEHGYSIRSISGCSIGSLIGGFYAAEKLDEFTQWISNASTFDLIKLLDFKEPNGLISGEKFLKKVNELLGSKQDIEKLSIQYTAFAADLKEEKGIWLNKGSLSEAIRASISIPLFFTPYELNGLTLIDGGVFNPVPIAATLNDKTDLTIAVNLNGTIDPQYNTPRDNVNTISENAMEYLQSITNIDRLIAKKNMYKVVEDSYDTMQGTIAKMELSAYPADIEIDIPRNLCGTLEFNRAEEIIKYGYNQCQKVLS